MVECSLAWALLKNLVLAAPNAEGIARVGAVAGGAWRRCTWAGRDEAASVNGINGDLGLAESKLVVSRATSAFVCRFRVAKPF